MDNQVDLDAHGENSQFHPNEPVALIIGCGDLGMACARALGRSHPLLIVDIAEEKLESCISMLRHEGYIADGVPCDITDTDQVAELGAILGARGGVRVLAHVAAVANTPGGWPVVIRVDLVGVHLIAKAVEPHLVSGAAAILISATGAYHCPRNPDIEALIDNPFVADLEQRLVTAFGRTPDFREAYFFAKQGVIRLAERLAIEWGSRNIRVVSVSPGLINSTMGRVDGAMMPVWDGGEARSVSRAEKAKIETPLRRQASLIEIATVVDFLASNRASFISGIDIPVDGGANAFWRARGVIER